MKNLQGPDSSCNEPTDGVWFARLTPNGVIINESLSDGQIIEAARAIAGRARWMEMNPPVGAGDPSRPEVVPMIRPVPQRVHGTPNRIALRKTRTGSTTPDM
jgi:hypothetical protein